MSVLVWNKTCSEKQTCVNCAWNTVSIAAFANGHAFCSASIYLPIVCPNATCIVLMVIPVVVSFRFCKNGKTTKQCSLSPKLFIMGAIEIMCTLTFCHFSHAISRFVSITFFINHKNSVPKLVKIWWWTGPWWFSQSAGSNCPSPWPRQGKQHRHSCQCLFSVWLIEKHSPVFFLWCSAATICGIDKDDLPHLQERFLLDPRFAKQMCRFECRFKCCSIDSNVGKTTLNFWVRPGWKWLNNAMSFMSFIHYAVIMQSLCSRYAHQTVQFQRGDAARTPTQTLSVSVPQTLSFFFSMRWLGPWVMQPYGGRGGWQVWQCREPHWL